MPFFSQRRSHMVEISVDESWRCCSFLFPTVHKVQVGESCNETQPSDDFPTSTCRFGLQSQNSRHLSDLRPGFHGLPHPIPRCFTWRHQAGDMESCFRRFYAIKACVVFARPSATVEPGPWWAEGVQEHKSDKS